MAVPSTCTKAHFQQLHSERNEGLKERVASIQVNTAKAILMSRPFCYGERISREVSEGIILHGDKLMTNAMAESDDEDDWEEDDDPEVEELNQMGDEYQEMTSSTALELVTDSTAETVELAKRVHTLYPLPKEESKTFRMCADNLGQGLQRIREFIAKEAHKGFSSCIVFNGDSCEDGVVFGGQQTVPFEVVEAQIQEMLKKSYRRVAPMALDLVMKDFNGNGLKVSTVRANDSEVERFIIDPE